MIKAPFNFVPLSDKVYFPDWAELISHDVPFEDGLSGSIELKITAQTPIFVRNGHTRKDAEEKNDTYKSFSKTSDGKYFIPATSIKGAIRSVMEIMSFGKMRLDKNMKFAQREWDDKVLFPIKDPKVQSKMRCGFLYEKEEGYVIVDCGKPYRIAHTRIDEYLNKSIFNDHFSKKSSFDITKETFLDGEKYDPKSASFKYKLVGNVNLSGLNFAVDNEYAVKFKENRVRVVNNGDFVGTIVLTGQPDKWEFPRPEKMTNGAGKFYDFVFPEPKEYAKEYEISVDEYNHFKFIYSDSQDWKLVKEKISKKGVPVFFRTENDRVKDWGLAFLYKLPYEKSPFETLDKDHKEEAFDLSECVFGGINKTKALKGRVVFSNAFLENAILSDSVKLTLSSPKASYYPLYIRQKNVRNNRVSNYETYNDGNISGWKRYLVRKKHFSNCLDNDDVDTELFPLKEGSSFSFKMVFNNLKRIELGALLSAITFHNTRDSYHQIGQGKPYGFGKVSVSIVKYPPYLPHIEELMSDYEEAMYNFCGESWVECEQVKNLITLAHEEVVDNDVFNYMVMSNTREDNEFLSAKIAKEYLEVYTKLCNQSVKILSLYESKKDELVKRRKEEAEMRERERLEREEQKRIEEEQRQREKEEKERKEANMIPFAEKIKGVSKIPTLLGNTKQWMKQNELEVLSERDKVDLKMKLLEVYNSLKDRDKKSFKKSFGKELDSIVGIELAKQWHEEIVNK